MDGSWHVYPAGREVAAAGHQARAVFATPENSAVGFLLQQLKLLPTAEESDWVGHLGPDLLDPDVGAAHRAGGRGRAARRAGQGDRRWRCSTSG